MTTTPASALRGLRSMRALLISATTLLLVLVLPAGVASAHTSFERSSPADGETIAAPVDVITLQYSGVSEPADDGFTVLAPDGQVRTPTSVSSTDQKTFELTFDPPLVGGEIGVRWSVSAPDAHPIDGAFSFIVTAPAPAEAAAADGDQPAGTAAVDSSLAPTAEDGADEMVMADGSVMDMTNASQSLDDFLAEPPARGGEDVARWGRLLEFAALTVLIGGGAFAATTLRGRRAEIDRTILVLRVLGVCLAAGALLGYVGAAQMAQASVAGYWSSQPGIATLLRGVGGLAIAAGLAAITVPIRTPRLAHSLSAAVNPTLEYEREERARFDADDPSGKTRPERFPKDRSNPSPAVRTIALDPLLPRHHQRTVEMSNPAPVPPRITISTAPPPRQTEAVQNREAQAAERSAPRHSERRQVESAVIRQWVLDRSSIAAYVGVAVAVMSFWFDGHTVSKGPRPVHAIVNSVHVVAGSVWIGGVVAMAVVLWTRHRAGVAPRALEMIVRFSGIATVALGAVLVAGGVMAFLVLDSVGELLSTQWGQVLLLKSAAAGLAMVGGAYNHFRLLPALEPDPDDPRLVEHLRHAVTAEAILLSFLIVVTASLVAAAS